MKTYRVHEFAKLINKSGSTLRRWDAQGILCPKRLPTNQRYYTDEDLKKILTIEHPNRKTIVYSRVSSSNQKNDLKSQIVSLETFCLNSGKTVDTWIDEVGSGLNYKRKKFLELISQIINNEIAEVIVAHKDRLTRFGFELIEYLAEQHNCKITVVNQVSLSPQQEMVEDLLSIVHCFSSRLYGLRKYKQILKKDKLDE